MKYILYIQLELACDSFLNLSWSLYCLNCDRTFQWGFVTVSTPARIPLENVVQRIEGESTIHIRVDDSPRNCPLNSNVWIRRAYVCKMRSCLSAVWDSAYIFPEATYSCIIGEIHCRKPDYSYMMLVVLVRILAELDSTIANCVLWDIQDVYMGGQR